MKLFSVILCAVLILGMVPLLSQGKAPAIHFDSMSQDFGKVTEGETLKHVFKFSNKGQATLDIIKVEPS